MPLPDDAWLLLHEVRLRGIATDDGTPTTTLLIEVGYITRVPRGLRVTTEGRVAHATWARVDRGSDVEAGVTRAYERFLPLNRELIQLCNDWQVRAGGVTNDHRDARYDWAILDRLRTLDERVSPVVRRLGATIERFAVYPPRLRAALERVDEGEHDWLTSPRIDSYHTVWMQLHEDLLLALGVERSSESPDQPS